MFLPDMKFSESLEAAVDITRAFAEVVGSTFTLIAI